MDSPSIETVKKDIAKIFSNDLFTPQFQEYSALYHMTTEDISTYIDSMHSSFTSTLTIGASCDQAIAASIKGAKDIYLFDINHLVRYLAELKKVAIENLNRQDFTTFLATDDGYILDYHIYQKINHLLSLPIRTFWNTLYELFNYNNVMINRILFFFTEQTAKNAKETNKFLANDTYYHEAQMKVKKTNWHFIPCTFYELDKHLPQNITFDSIILSNIYEYLNCGKNLSVFNAQLYLNYIKKVLLTKLNTNGVCMASYLYRYNQEIDYIIKEQLLLKPNKWFVSDSMFADKEQLLNYLNGYTDQNVSYHYLLDELDKSNLNVQKIKTKAMGYGNSPANNDLAILIKSH